MYNLCFDVAGLMVAFLLIGSNLYRKMTKELTDKLFMSILILSAVTTIMDLLSAILVDYVEPSAYVQFYLFLVNTIYFLCHNMILPFFYAYCFSVMGVWYIVKQKKICMFLFYVYAVLLIGMIVLNIFTGWVFYISDDCHYIRGKYLLVLYIAYSVLVAVGTYLMIYMRKYEEKVFFGFFMSIIPINMVAIIIQGLFPKILVEMFFIIIELLAFVIVIQRKNSIVDPVTGAKKYNDGVKSLKKIMDIGIPVNILLIKFANNNGIRMFLGQNEYNSLIKKISGVLREYLDMNNLDSQVYYLEYGLFGLMTEEKDEEKLAFTAEKIRVFFDNHVSFDEYEIHVDARMVWVNCPQDIDNYRALFCYAVTFHNSIPKSDKVLRYSEYANEKENVVKNEMESIIERGLQENLFEIHYQPIYSVEKNSFVAAEALLRLEDPQYGVISPALLIQAAELSGKMYKIGDVVFEKVCDFVANNDLKKMGIDHININLSPSQCVQADIVKKIRGIIKEKNIDPSMIKLEITEGAADYDPIIVDQNIKALSEEGIGFILDNYGIGYSNIKRITELPVEIVKVDKSFIKSYNNANMKIIVDDTVAMLKKMGKKVLMEGIENKITAEHFADVGCDYIQGCEFLQGFYFSNVLPPKEFIHFISSETK